MSFIAFLLVLNMVLPQNKRSAPTVLPGMEATHTLMEQRVVSITCFIRLGGVIKKNLSDEVGASLTARK